MFFVRCLYLRIETDVGRLGILEAGIQHCCMEHMIFHITSAFSERAKYILLRVHECSPIRTSSKFLNFWLWLIVCVMGVYGEEKSDTTKSKQAKFNTIKLTFPRRRKTLASWTVSCITSMGRWAKMHGWQETEEFKSIKKKNALWAG